MVQASRAKTSAKNTTSVVFNICNDAGVPLISVEVPEADSALIKSMNKNRVATALGALREIAKQVNNGTLKLDIASIKAAAPSIISVDAGEHSHDVRPNEIRAGLMDAVRNGGAFGGVVDDESLKTIRKLFGHFSRSDENLTDQTLEVSRGDRGWIILGHSLTRSNLPDSELVAAALIRMVKRQGHRHISADTEGYSVPSSEWKEFAVAGRMVTIEQVKAAIKKLSKGINAETVALLNEHFPQLTVINAKKHPPTPKEKTTTHRRKQASVTVIDPGLFANDGSVS